MLQQFEKRSESCLSSKNTRPSNNKQTWPRFSVKWLMLSFVSNMHPTTQEIEFQQGWKYSRFVPMVYELLQYMFPYCPWIKFASLKCFPLGFLISSLKKKNVIESFYVELVQSFLTQASDVVNVNRIPCESTIL